MKKKLKIADLKVDSFVTSDEMKLIFSGAEDSNLDPGRDCSTKVEHTYIYCITNEETCVTVQTCELL